MSVENPLISVLILNYNGLHHLADCFQSLESQDYKDWELVFVDNHSHDGSVEWVRAHYPFAKVVQNPSNLGFAGGNNQGLPHCKGQWIFFLNNDTTLEPDCLQYLAQAIQSHSDSQCLFAPLMVQMQHPDCVDSAGDELYTWGPSYKYANCNVQDPLFQTPREVAMACGGAAVFSKELLQRIGGFDESFFLLFEDVDLSLRARHAGAHIWCIPQARVRHKGSASIGKMSKIEAYYSNRNLFWAKLKNYPALTLLKYAPAELFTTLLSFKGSVVRGVMSIWLKAHWDSVRAIPEMLQKRSEILSQSHISRQEFERWLRKGWFLERLRLHLRGR